MRQEDVDASTELQHVATCWVGKFLPELCGIYFKSFIHIQSLNKILSCLSVNLSTISAASCVDLMCLVQSGGTNKTSNSRPRTDTMDHDGRMGENERSHHIFRLLNQIHLQYQPVKLCQAWGFHKVYVILYEYLIMFTYIDRYVSLFTHPRKVGWNKKQGSPRSLGEARWPRHTHTQWQVPILSRFMINIETNKGMLQFWVCHSIIHHSWS